MKDKKEIILSDFQALTIDAKVSNPGRESRAVVRESESRLEYDMFASFFFCLRLDSDLSLTGLLDLQKNVLTLPSPNVF